MQTDDLAAQMVREIVAAILASDVPLHESLEAIARRYIEKLFTEDDLWAACSLNEMDDGLPMTRERLIAAVRAGKESPHDR